MNTTLWILQIVLAAMFALAGVLKTTQPSDKLLKNMPWVADVSAGTLKLIGTAELLGALGLILPAVTGIATFLTPLAASGLAVIMALAAATHARRKEPQAIVFNLTLLAVAAFIAWGRFGPYSF